jgi:uncharacterized protein YcnI
MRAAVIAVVLVGASTVVQAHVTVSPRESQGGAVERYTVRVPTEGKVTTTSVELEVPTDVTITDVVAGTGYTFETRKERDRVVAITWKQDIKPGDTGRFVFVARNPLAQQIAWKTRQRFADGSSADWVGVQGDRRPASVTQLTTTP